MSERRTPEAIRACAAWLAACLRFGWSKRELGHLEALWWRYHDARGQLKRTP